MYSQGFKEEFNDNYDFIDFIHATGLKAPYVGPAYKDFQRFAWHYIQRAGLAALSECFEVWLKTANIKQ